MRHVTIELSEAQEFQLSERLAAGEFASLDAYVGALIEAELQTAAQDRLEEQLLEGLRGEDILWTSAVMDRIRRAAHLMP